MRGPDLVGYPPTALRWSADSQKLYFDWRKPGEDGIRRPTSSAATAATPRKLTDEEAKNVPPANGAGTRRAAACCSQTTATS